MNSRPIHLRRSIIQIIILLALFILTSSIVLSQSGAGEKQMPQGAATATLSATTDAVQLGDLPLTLTRAEGDRAATPIVVAVETLASEQAWQLSPLGFAFDLTLTPQPSKLQLAAEPAALQLTLDYSTIPFASGGSVTDRLHLYRVSECAEVTLPATKEGGREQPAQTTLHCAEWELLPGHNDYATQQLTVDLPLAAVGTGAEAAAEKVAVGSQKAILVLAAGAAGQQGDYSFTPLSAVSDYQVALNSGAATTGYPIPVPPARAGAAPDVSLGYNSGSVDGMHQRKNNQPGAVGIGWTLNSGSVIRHLKTCASTQAPGDLCLPDDESYTIILNGTSSRLVHAGGNQYRLQSDPHWRVELLTDGATGHPDAHNEYWLVTTPDGTQYRFGGEFVPESSADQNSVFYVPVYDAGYVGTCDYALCDKAWQWNLDRSEDTNGNVINYFYELETNFYKARNDSREAFRKEYVRAGFISHIEYTHTAGQTTSPHARVLFNMELRCTDPASETACEWPTDFPDTPGDLECDAYPASCSQNAPTFWSQRRLDSVQTQVADDVTGAWRTVAFVDLTQSFPTPPTDGQGDTSEAKLWLDSITQRPGGDYAHSAFVQLEAEDYDTQSGIDTEVAYDVGGGRNVGWADDGDFIVFDRVDFGSGATDVTARVASIYAGRQIELRLDSTTGTLVSTIDVPNTGDWQAWETVETTVTGASGIHDLYLVFKNSGMNINWLRFAPTNPLPGLPPVSYDYEMLANRRNHDVNGVSPMNMPRIDHIDTELGGAVDFTYGQSHACPVLPSGGTIRMPYDCFPAWDSGDPNTSADDGWVLWHKWKVLAQQSSDTFSGNDTVTLDFDYSTPTWHYNNDPTLDDINSCSLCPTRHWNDFRGSEIVTVTDAFGTQTEHRFHRGMDGDRLGTSGGSFAASITLSDATTRTDSPWLSGNTVESRQLDASDVALTRSVNWFTATGTAGSGNDGAYFVALQKTEETIYGTTPVTTRNEYVYDSYGNVTLELLHGDVSTTDDDRHVERAYLTNSTDYIVDRILWEKLRAGVTPHTSSATCTTYPSSDVPKYITWSGTPTVTSDVTVATGGNVVDVNVLDLSGTHTYINQLSFHLAGPNSTSVEIMERSCAWQDNWNIDLDDEATPGAWPCPPTDGNAYQPSHALSALDNQDAAGTWQLSVTDHLHGRSGWLNSWGVEICTADPIPPLTGVELAYTEYAYDGGTIGTVPTVGNPTLTRSYHSITPTVGYVDTTATYDSAGRPLTVTDGNSNTSTTAYHTFYGYGMTATNALSHTMTTVADPGWGVPLTVTDANGKVTTVAYDAYGRLSEVWLPGDVTTGPASAEYVYTPEARPAYVKSRQLIDATTPTYLEAWAYVDGFGRTLQSQSPQGTSGQRIVGSTAYDAAGRVRESSSAYQLSGAPGSGYVQPVWNTLDSVTRPTYDELGRVVLDQLLSNNVVLLSSSAVYDGLTVTTTDANGHETDRSVDAFGQLRSVTEYNDEGSGTVSYTTTYSYTLQGGLAAVTDDASNTTTMSYDLLGRKTAMSDPDMGDWLYQYDAIGNLVAQQDGRGLWLHMSYDSLNRLLEKRRDTTNGTLLAATTYDTLDLGLPDTTTAYDSSGTQTVQTQIVSRDDRYRTTEQQTIVTGSGTFRMATTYDAAGRVATQQYPGGNTGTLGETVQYNYDTVGRLDQVVSLLDNTHFVDSVSYLATGQVSQLRLDQGSNGATLNRLYETGTHRLQEKNAGSGNGLSLNLQRMTYSYDDGGNVATVTDIINSSQVQTFDYDWLDRLTSAATSLAGTGQYDQTYSYDSIGNITDFDGNAYTYDSQRPHAVATAHGNSYGYDGNGNQVTRTIGGTTYTQVFDYENRLVEMKQGSTTLAEFVYDAAGNRITGTVNSVTTVYIGGVYEYQGGATTTYYAGPTGAVALRRAGYLSNNGVFYLLGDHLGSTSTIVAQNSTVAAQSYYLPYGGNRGGVFSNITTKRFTGQYHEASLPGGEGLSYYNARWYDAQLGRFVSADSIVPEPGRPQAFNRYSYGIGNPVKYIDPSGHGYCVTDDCGIMLSQNQSHITFRRPPTSRTPPIYQAIWQIKQGPRNARRNLEWLFGSTQNHDHRAPVRGQLRKGSLGDLKGDDGFRPELQDNHHYVNLWGYGPGNHTTQVGHFLTAVAMNYYFETVYSSSLFSGISRRGDEDFWIRLIVGHEQYTDRRGLRTIWEQYNRPDDADFQAFRNAVMYDAAGDNSRRDTSLRTILSPTEHGALSERTGNSMEDLRLSVRGWRLGGAVASGSIRTSDELATWILLNIAGG